MMQHRKKKKEQKNVQRTLKLAYKLGAWSTISTSNLLSVFKTFFDVAFVFPKFLAIELGQ